MHTATALRAGGVCSLLEWQELVASLGFAPRPSGSKPGMLRLHHEVITKRKRNGPNLRFGRNRAMLAIFFTKRRDTDVKSPCSLTITVAEV